MNTYHPHCNQHIHTCGGVHYKAQAAVATPAVTTPLPYFYMTEYEGYKKHRIKVRNVKGYSAEEQMADHIREHEANEEWKLVRVKVFLGLAGLIGYLILASWYMNG